MNLQPARPVPTGTGRATWHRRVAALPLAYLVGIVAVGFAHPFLPSSRWLLIHLLLLGAATNAIVIWSSHFATAVLRATAPATRRAEATRLAVLNLGVVAVLAAGVSGAPWVGVAGAAAVFGAVSAHLASLARRVRAALPARFAVTVHYYLAATAALLTGVPVGAWMLVVDDAARPRLLLFHAHVNLLGWVALTVLGTLLTLWPTVLRTRVADGAARAAAAALPLAVVGLAVVGVGVLAWWPPLAAAGTALFAAGVLVNVRPAVAAARHKPPSSFAAWSIAAAGGWLLVALGVDGWMLLSAADPADGADRFAAVLIPLLAGFVGQVLVGALAYLLPMALGGGPGPVRERTLALDRHWPQRVAMANAALVVFALPAPPYVRIAVSLLGLVALSQFLVPAVRLLLGRTAGAQARPLGGLAVGLVLVLLAVAAGATAERATGPGPVAGPSGDLVPATGHTTTVTVTAAGMRFAPDRIEVPAGDRLIIEITNTDNRRHDLVLATGARTPIIGRGASASLDAGIIGAEVQGWCSLPGHRQAGMTLTIAVTGGHGSASSGGQPGEPATDPPRIDAMADPGAAFSARDATAPVPPDTRLHRITLRVQEVRREVAPGVRQRLWTFNGTAPGPVLRGRVGDVFEITLINDGTIDHGVDFHAGALAPDRPMRPIDPGQRLVYRFTATKAGIWMYHCSTMPMLHHIGNGMYGAVIIDPPGLPAVEREYVLVQSELYLGPDGEPGDLGKMQAERPDAVVFNGYVSQYAHRPLAARAGQRVRIWVLNAGPNRASAFHIVGAHLDTVYREGQWQVRSADPGAAAVLDLAPAAGGFVETVFAEPGRYPFLTHVMVDAERGARGVFEVAP